MGNLNSVFSRMLDSLKEYRYGTFLIGAVLPPQMLEREDKIRSKFKIKGTENLKSQLTRELGKKLSKEYDKNVDYVKPDVTINVDLVEDDISVRARPVFVFGRYVKRTRGLAQKQEKCPNCRGKGCAKCEQTGLGGFYSIEGIIFRKLKDSFKCESAKFAWIGGEDKDSLVLDGGRPFFVKIVNPKNRFARPRGLKANGVEVRFVKRVERFPDKPLRFRMKVRMLVESECQIGDDILKKIRDLKDEDISFSVKQGKEVSRTIYNIDAKKSNGLIKISMDVDGGLPVKQFVTGNEINPSISEVIGCKTLCNNFDVLGVRFTEQ